MAFETHIILKPLGICVDVCSVRERKGLRIALGIRWFVMPLFEKGIAGGRVGFAWKPSSGLLVC